MIRATFATAALALLAGCPLPQPLPDYPPGSVTPPRILMDQITYRDTVIAIPAGCPTAPSWDLAAALVDTNTTETVTARWFVDYDRRNSRLCRYVGFEDILGPGDQASDPTRRAVAPFRFVPYDYEADPKGAAGVLHVVELVVSNRFDPAADVGSLCTPDVAAETFPFRTPARDGTVQFETQTYRWVFVSKSGLPCP